MSPRPHAALVAVAKNESFYLTEWIAHHLAIGFDRILVFNNDSSDASLDLLNQIARLDPRLTAIDWPSRPGVAPQEAAYNHAVSLIDSEWICFLDIDEFLVPWRDATVAAYLATVPGDIAQVHVNWRGFGASGLSRLDYGLVTSGFTAAAPEDWPNHLHYKSLIRRAMIEQVFIHYARLRGGRRALTDFGDVPPDNIGIAPRVVYDGIQINHYQCKTWPEFRRRMNNGAAYAAPGDPGKFRDGSRQRFAELDQHGGTDTRIRPFVSQTQIAVEMLERFLPPHLASARLRSDWAAQMAVPAQDGGAKSGHALLAWHGGLLCRDSDGPELFLRSLFDPPEASLPIMVKPGHTGQDGFSPAALPGNLPLAEAELVPGPFEATVALRCNARYLSAGADGRLTLTAVSLGEDAGFLPLPEASLTHLRRLKTTAWRRQDLRIIPPGAIRIGAGFILDIGDLAFDLRRLRLSAAGSGLVLETGDETLSLKPAEGWHREIAAAFLEPGDDEARNFPQRLERLREAGFEGIGFDFRTRSASFHLPDGGFALADPAAAVRPAPAFDQPAVITAIRGFRADPRSPARFREQLAAAGCAGYQISFTARRVLYFGRLADTLVEQLAS